MENSIMREIRKVRKTLDLTYRKDPGKTRERWKKIEAENKHRLVKGSPRMLGKRAA
jgi:hypothetical protein